MKDAIECFISAAFVFIVCALSFFKMTPYIEKKDEPAKKKKKYLLFFRITFISGTIGSIYLTVVGILIIAGIL
ncbi:hypothetical protein FACS1894130_01710 [Spirochaetia bacterium]|nr:hypothetical protein FACS1894130_01710 [Spirochaetia bacterium]